MSPREIMVACLKCLPLWDHSPMSRKEREAVFRLAVFAVGVVVLYYCALLWEVERMLQNYALVWPM